MDLRSGGQGDGNKKAPSYAAPKEWVPRLIRSTLSGVSITVFDSETSPVTKLDTEEAWVPPETDLSS